MHGRMQALNRAREVLVRVEGAHKIPDDSQAEPSSQISGSGSCTVVLEIFPEKIEQKSAWLKPILLAAFPLLLRLYYFMGALVCFQLRKTTVHNLNVSSDT